MRSPSTEMSSLWQSKCTLGMKAAPAVQVRIAHEEGIYLQ